jgi:predicted DCC family thiol-disulfide oxidoreductase YuxK
MNALNNHVIIYDDSCPMCTWYTGQFVKAGALTQDGRVSFAEMGGLQQHLDLDKARHQIPLIDTATGTTRYGLEAIFLILTNIFPTLSGVLSSRFVHRLIEPLYKFISLNRRVIVPCPANRKGFDASPDFDFGYRLLYLFLGTGLVLFTHTCLIAGYLNPNKGGSYWQISFLLTALADACCLLPALLVLLFSLESLSVRMDFAANLVSSMLSATLKMLPINLIFIALPDHLSVGFFPFAVIGFQFFYTKSIVNRISNKGFSKYWFYLVIGFLVVQIVLFTLPSLLFLGTLISEINNLFHL